MRNSGEIETYCRVTIYRDWRNSEGENDFTLSRDLIKLNIPAGNGWIIGEQESNERRTVLYYTKPLLAGETTPNVIETLSVDSSIKTKVSKTVTNNQDGNQTITTSYTYNGYKFNILINVDAIQTHNAENSILSAWGRKVNIAEDGTLSLP